MAPRRRRGAHDEQRQGAGGAGRHRPAAQGHVGALRRASRRRRAWYARSPMRGPPGRWCWSRAPTSSGPTSPPASHRRIRRRRSEARALEAPTGSSAGCSTRWTRTTRWSWWAPHRRPGSDALTVAAVRAAGLRSGAPAVDDDPTQRLRQPHRLRPDDPALLRHRSPGRDGGTADGDRRGRGLARVPHRVPRERQRRRPVPRRARRSVDGGHRGRCLPRWPSPSHWSTGGGAVPRCSRSAHCGCSATSTPPISPVRCTSPATAVPACTGRSSSASAQ